MGEHPILTFFLALIAAGVITAPLKYGFMAYNRTLRAKNIKEKGWPPAHLDADGDHKTK